MVGDWIVSDPKERTGRQQTCPRSVECHTLFSRTEYRTRSTVPLSWGLARVAGGEQGCLVSSCLTAMVLPNRSSVSVENSYAKYSMDACGEQH
jgi:hypothetical protein